MNRYMVYTEDCPGLNDWIKDNITIQSFTVQFGQGWYNGVKEQCAIFTFITDEMIDVELQTIFDKFCKDFAQECVMFVKEKVQAKLYFAK